MFMDERSTSITSICNTCETPLISRYDGIGINSCYQSCNQIQLSNSGSSDGIYNMLKNIQYNEYKIYKINII